MGNSEIKQGGVVSLGLVEKYGQYLATYSSSERTEQFYVSKTPDGTFVNLPGQDIDILDYIQGDVENLYVELDTYIDLGFDNEGCIDPDLGEDPLCDSSGVPVEESDEDLLEKYSGVFTTTRKGDSEFIGNEEE